MRTRITARLAMAAALLAGVAAGNRANAQAGPLPTLAPPGRAGGEWVTVDAATGTDGAGTLRIHARREYRRMARAAAPVATRWFSGLALETGITRPPPITVLIDDPQHQSNGSAISWLDAPLVRLYPVPPGPRSQVGRSTSWTELLVVHELAHVVHLAQGRRYTPFRWWGLPPSWLPGRFGPVTATPRWVKEGYATVLEGRFTGRGRPYSPLRAAMLREWAARGRLPTYAGLNGGSRWQDGRFAYLAGSAFLEHLAGAPNDSSLRLLWRRLTSPTRRGFTTAFEQTFGERPDDAWSRYAAELTADALALERAVDAAGRVRGDLVARLARGTDDPAISPDGTRVALAPNPAPGGRRSVVIWSTDTGTDAARDSAREAAAARRRDADPEDPPPVPRIPRGRRALHVLPPDGPAAFGQPRWFRSGERLLVIRGDVRPDGAVRPDVFVWTPETGRVRRLTHGASIREAEPLAGDTLAVGTRCRAGGCDLVRIDLTDGTVETLVAGDLATQFARPRGSPDGRTVVAAQQWRRFWRPVLVDVASGTVRALHPDASATTDGTPVDRYDPTFTRDGRAVLFVSEATGIPQLVRHRLADQRETTLSRVFSAAFAPEPFPGDSALYFLRLDAGGEEVRRLPVGPDGLPPLPASLRTRLRDSALHPLIARAAGPDTSGRAEPLAPFRPYGTGTRRATLLPLGGASLDGGSVGGAVGAVDPVGRFGWLLLGLGSSDRRAEVGGAVRATWRGPVFGRGVTLEGELVRARVASGANRSPDRVSALTRDDVFAESRARWSGGTLSATVARDGLRGRSALRIGAAVHDVRLDAPPRGRPMISPFPMAAPATEAGARRGHLFVDAQRTHRLGRDARRATVDLRVHASRSAGLPELHVGTEGPEPFADDRLTPNADPVLRAMARADVTVRLAGLRVSWEGLAGTVSAHAPAGEAFGVGGLPAQLISGMALPQRVPTPWLGAGELLGRDVALHTVRLNVPSSFTPFASAVRADGTWRRAAGLDVRLATLADPADRLPGIDVTAGLAYLFDGRNADRVRAWAGVTFRP